MRIAWLVHQYLPQHVGGTELYTHGLATRARADGHSVLVVTYSEHPGADPSCWRSLAGVHDGVSVIEIEHNLSLAPSVARYEYDNPIVGESVSEALAKHRPDVVHCTHALKLSASALDACTAMGVPYVITLCDFWFICARHTLLRSDGSLCGGPDDPGACWRCTHDLHGIDDTPEEFEAVRARAEHLRAVLFGAKGLIALSDFQRRMFELNGIGRERMEVIPHGLELDGLDVGPINRKRGPARLVFIGSLVPHKGLHILLAALRARPKLDLELLVYGALEPGGPYVERLVAEARGDERIKLAGTFPPDRLGQVLANADALVLPALWYENDPLAVKAALHVGLPAMVSRIGSLAEQVRDGVDGWTVAAGDIEAWAQAIELAANERLRVRMPRPQQSMDDHYARLAQIYASAAAA